MKCFLTLLIIIPFAVSAQLKDSAHLNFDYNKYAITETAKSRLTQFLAKNAPVDSILTINLAGHCDFRGSDEYNDKLSLQRVDAVKDQLAALGIPADKIRNVAAFGEQKPLNTNSTEDEMAANRRVEIEIIMPMPIVKQVIKEEPKTLTQQLGDTSTRVGKTLVLRNLNFIGGRHVLLPGSLPVLEELLSALRTNPSLQISIEGHVCCAQGFVDGLDIDTRTYNLSVNRAKMVYEYLVKNGIDSSRLAWDGYGNKYPLVATEITEEDRTMNRRVEIKILKK